jgi:hypothetical protein
MSDSDYIKELEDSNAFLQKRSEDSERKLQEYVDQMGFLKSKMVNSVKEKIQKAINNITVNKNKIRPLNKNSSQKVIDDNKNLVVSGELYDNLMKTIDDSLESLSQELDKMKNSK